MDRSRVIAGNVHTQPERGDVANQVKTLLPVFVLVGGAIVVLGAIILIVYYTTHINVHHLVADPSEIAFLPEYTGVYSYLGVLILWTAAVLSVVTGSIVRGAAAVGRISAFFLTFGLLLGWLAADDLFMWHEWAGLLIAQAIGADDVGSARSRLEAIVFAIMGAVWIVWLVRFRRTILSTEYLLLLAAFAGFGLSVLIDLSGYVFPALEPETVRMRTTVAILEELLKMTGILFMLAYVVRMAAPVFRQAQHGASVD